MRNTLVVMVKEPRPGRVKTRLGKDIGMTTAAWWFRHQVSGLLRRLEDPRWDMILAVTPDIEGLTSRVWPSHLPRIGQGQGDLGDRMGRVLKDHTPGRVCIIGADIPAITKPAIQRAFTVLGDHDAVFGPAPDGGYWLVGATRTQRGMFDNVRWSTEHALADTMATFAGFHIATVDTLADVDHASDLVNSPLGVARQP